VVNVADGTQRLAKVNVGQGVAHFGHNAGIGPNVRAALQRFDIDEIGRRGAGTKVGPAGANVNIVVGVAIASKNGKTARGHLQRLSDQIGRNSDLQSVYPGPGLLENIARFVVMHLQAGLFQ